eukprot:335135-Pelagomonas_calceolata.AAC.1
MQPTTAQWNAADCSVSQAAAAAAVVGLALAGCWVAISPRMHHLCRTAACSHTKRTASGSGHLRLRDPHQ